MKKQLRVKDIRELTGLTGAEISWFHHEKVVKAAGFSNYSVEGYDGYKLFDEDAVPKFQQIAMYYDLGLRRDQIRDIMLAPDYDFDRALDGLYIQLKEKRDRIDRHMTAIDHLRMIGTKGKTMDYLSGISLEKLGENYQKLQHSAAWLELQALTQEKFTEEYAQIIEGHLERLIALDDTALSGPEGTEIITKIFEASKEHLGMMGYMAIVSIAMCVLGDGTLVYDTSDALGTDFSEAQAEAVATYVTADVEQFFKELIDVIVRYHNFFGRDYNDPKIEHMVADVKDLLSSHFGIRHDIEYQLLFEFVPPVPNADKTAYLQHILNAVYHHHSKENQ